MHIYVGGDEMKQYHSSPLPLSCSIDGLWGPVLSGVATLFLVLLYAVMDLGGFKIIFRPFQYMGMNAIILYTGSEFVPNVLSMMYRGNPSRPLYIVIQETLFTDPMGALPGSLVFALCHVGFWLLVGFLLWRKKIFVRL